MAHAVAMTAGRPQDAIDPEFWTFFRQSHVALYLAAPDGALMEVNEAAARLLGARSPGDALRQPVNVFDWRRTPAERRAFAMLLERSEAGESIRTRITGLAGQEIVVDECACRTSATRIIGAIIRVEAGAEADLARAAMARDLERLKIEAERATRFKSAFLANLSHELRTPLNGIIGGADIILAREVDATAREFAGVIRKSGEQLLALLNDVLDLSKLESGQMAAHFEPVDLTETLEALDRRIRPLAAAKNLSLEIRRAVDAPMMIESDGARLQQILYGLLHNAVKFTERGGVALDISVQGAAPGVLVFAVQDTGCGIDEAELDRVFIPYEQVDSATARRHGGAGLGLTLGMKLADLIGGSLSVASRAGVGSTFTLRLPLAERAVFASPRGVANDVEAPARDGSVLVVDDVPMNVMIATELLKQLGCSAVGAGGGREAIERLRRESFRAVLMDVSMPDLDGVAATTEIRALGGAAAKTPIIAVTANVFPGDRERYLEAGMDGYISKPVTADALRAELARLFPDA